MTMKNSKVFKQKVELTSSERHIKYLEHRHRVLNAKSVIDSAPPDRTSQQSNNRNLSYVEMLATLSFCNATPSPRTFTRMPDALAMRSVPNLLHGNHRNPDCRSMCGPHLDNKHKSNESNSRKWSRSPIKSTMSLKRSDIPDHVIKRYENMGIPYHISVLKKLLRPKIYLDMEMKDLRPLGRLVIQLYTEACPEVVLEFVRVCTSQQSKHLIFTRLFPPLWCEGELILDNDQSLSTSTIEHDTRVLDHGSGAGILSFPSRYVRGSKRRFLSFTLSFKPLKVLNGKRIAFGRVRRGFWILDTLQDFGSKTGKPTNQIIVKKCGLLKH